MQTIFRKQKDFHKFGCRYLRRFKVLDGEIQLDVKERHKLLDIAKSSEQIFESKLAQVHAGKMIIHDD